MDAALELLDDLEGIEQILLRLIPIHFTLVPPLNSLHPVIRPQRLQHSGLDPHRLPRLTQLLRHLLC